MHHNRYDLFLVIQFSVWRRKNEQQQVVSTRFFKNIREKWGNIFSNFGVKIPEIFG